MLCRAVLCHVVLCCAACVLLYCGSFILHDFSSSVKTDAYYVSVQSDDPWTQELASSIAQALQACASLPTMLSEAVGQVDQQWHLYTRFVSHQEQTVFAAVRFSFVATQLAHMSGTLIS